MLRLVATLEQVEKHLFLLGGGNHPDNMRRLAAFPNFFLMELEEGDFWDLVFLQNEDVLLLAPRGSDRRLRAVAVRALRIREAVLSPNWSLPRIANHTMAQNPERPGFSLQPLILRDASVSERHNGGAWYIQDGSHRALGYARAVLWFDVPYQNQLAYCATVSQLDIPFASVCTVTLNTALQSDAPPAGDAPLGLGH